MRTIIRTFDGDIYIIEGKSKGDVHAATVGQEWMLMPNGDYVRPTTFAAIQDDVSYSWQSKQKARHKKGQYIEGGEWRDTTQTLGIKAELEKVTGELLKLAPPKS